jgi:hypothetical protein
VQQGSDPYTPDRMVSYDVVGLLGRGGSAVVELAVDSTGRRVATKRVALSGSEAQMQVARRRLRREAAILSGLAHPGIVPVIDVVDDGSEIVLIFPALIENLEDRVGRLGPLPPGEVARIGRVLTEALAAAHRHGVVHRDIKPANVLFDESGHPALADFGVAATREVTAGLTEPGAVIGTPMWMAPEQARGEPAGPAGDVFSLAATIHFAATGRGPYAPGPAAAVVARAAAGEIRAVAADLPGALRAPLVRMLDPRPERRPSAAEVLGGTVGTTLTPPGALPPAGEWAPTVPGRLRRPRRIAKARTAEWASPVPGEPRRARRIATARAGEWRPQVPGARCDPMARHAGRWVARVLGDPPDPMVRPSRRRRWWAAAGGAVAAAVVASVVVIGSTGRGDGRLPAAAGGPAAATCTPLPYFPCSALLPAAHTNGRICDPGWYDLDGIAANGCEARSDYRAGAALVPGRPVHANLVPPSTSDTFAAHVSGHILDLCWGSLHVTLTAPGRTAERLTLWKGATRVASAVSVDGVAATVTVPKPSCFGADSEDLRATVTTVLASGGASAANFTLTRDSGW